MHFYGKSIQQRVLAPAAAPAAPVGQQLVRSVDGFLLFFNFGKLFSFYEIFFSLDIFYYS